MKPAARRMLAAAALAVTLGCGLGSAALAGAPSPVSEGSSDRPVQDLWNQGREAGCRATTADLDGGCSVNHLH